MPFQMEDMNAVELDGGDYCQNSGSSSSSICSSEEDSARTSSTWTAGVQIECRQPL